MIVGIGIGGLVAVAFAMNINELRPNLVIATIAGWALFGMVIFVSVQIAQTSRGVGDRPFVAAMLAICSVMLGPYGLLVLAVQFARVHQCFRKHGRPLPPFGWGADVTDQLPTNVSHPDAADSR